MTLFLEMSGDQNWVRLVILMFAPRRRHHPLPDRFAGGKLASFGKIQIRASPTASKILIPAPMAAIPSSHATYTLFTYDIKPVD
jgi:hypothetical protein